MYLAFYKAPGDMSDKLIRWWTKSKYSHVELVTDDYSTMYSSSGMDGGVRKKPHQYDTDIWTYVEVSVSEELVKDIFSETNGFKYDWFGILGFILPLQDRTNRWFCSEWCSNVLKCGGDKRMYLQEPSKLSPGKLYNLVKKD